MTTTDTTMQAFDAWTQGSTTYSPADLQQTARAALRLHNCPACIVDDRRNKRLTLKDWFVVVEQGAETALGIVGECRKHSYTETFHSRLGP